MTDQAATSAKGLEGVVIAQTQLSVVDGQIGKLLYHGYNIKDVAEHASFEEVAYLLWYNKLPNKSELQSFNRELADNRDLPRESDTSGSIQPAAGFWSIPPLGVSRDRCIESRP